MHPLSAADLQSFFQSNLPTYQEMLRQMVAINTFTANAAGVNALGALTAEMFRPLGFSLETTPSATAQYGRHHVLVRPGNSGRKIGLVSHLDTVFPAEEERRNDFGWRVEGDRAYGPGTNDIKGGTVQIFMTLAALHDLAPEVFEEITWIVLLDASEEVMSDDFGEVCLRYLVPGGLACLVFEAGIWEGDVFTLVRARKGRALYRVQATGRGAHAGAAHDKGANAIVQLAHTIQKIAGLTDYARKLTFNVGAISGGTVINRVPHAAECWVEMRAFTPEVFDAGVAGMMALNGEGEVRSSDGFACQVQVEMVEQTAPWPVNPGTEALIRLWRETAAGLGQTVVTEERGGLSDGNLTWAQIPTVDGLGPYGENSHCSERSADGSKDQEYVLLSSFVPKAVLNTLAIGRLAAEGLG